MKLIPHHQGRQARPPRVYPESPDGTWRGSCGRAARVRTAL